MDFVSNTKQEIKIMLDAAGVKDMEELFDVIPPELKASRSKLPKGMSELEVARLMESLARRNHTVKEYCSFLGGGAYEHYIPSVVDALISRSEFYTAYTPYQPEASQGMLQAVFEYQSLICELTGMDVANASLYDGATAVAEAAAVSLNSTKLSKVIVSEAVNPQYKQVVQTFFRGRQIELIGIPFDKNGQTSIDDLKKFADDKTACVVVQSPNFLGVIEPMDKIAKLKENGKKMVFISVVNPVSLGILKSPGEYGADIAVGEGQVLGSPLNYGGPCLGFMAAKDSFAWKIPGRIVGMTNDKNQNPGFVLTLQTREQHIKREKASSNICSNQALNALSAAVYMTVLGKQGIVELGRMNIQACRYLMEGVNKLDNYEAVHDESPHFNEFVVKSKIDIDAVLEHLMKKKILGGIKLDKYFPNCENLFLVAVTETKNKNDLDNFISALQEVK